MDGSARFWDRFAERYARMPVRDEAAYQRKLEITRGYFRPEMEVLEIGCGTGSTALAHAPFVKRIRALDVSSKMIDIARRKAEAAGIENVGFEQGTIESLQLPDQSLDAVLALNLLHLVNDENDFIARVHAMLKPGGVFVSSTPCLGDSSYRFLKYVGPFGAWLGLMPKVRVFTVKELIDSLKRAGFAIDHQWLPGKNKAAFVVAKKNA